MLRPRFQKREKEGTLTGWQKAMSLMRAFDKDDDNDEDHDEDDNDEDADDVAFR